MLYKQMMEVKCDGYVHLVMGEDGDCYGAYLLEENAKARKEQLADVFGDSFYIDSHGLGNLRVR